MAVPSITDEDLEQMAMEEILKETKRNSERAKEFGSLGWQNPRKTANKRFLSNMLVSTLRNPLQRNSHTIGSEREKRCRHLDSDRVESHRDRKHSKGERLDSSPEYSRKNHHQSLQDFERSQKTGRHEKTKENFHHRVKHSSESPENLYRVKESVRQNERKNGSKRQYSSDRESNHNADHRSYPKVRRSDGKCRDNREESRLHQEGPPNDLSDNYHKDYMEYIQNYKKHMNYFEKMEEKEFQQKHARSFHSEERDTCLNNTKEKNHSSERIMHKKSKKSKKKRKHVSSESDENPSSDLPKYGKKCLEKGLCNSFLQSNEKSRNKRKKSKEKLHKSAKEKMKIKSTTSFSNSGPKKDVNIGEKLERDNSEQCDDVLKGDNSSLSNLKETFSKEKKLKHKKHKDKKRKKYTEDKDHV